MTRILVVDDEPLLLKALQVDLRARHYTVETASDGRGALLEAMQNPPDAVILDLGLPQIDGHHVLQALRAWSQVPVIILSGRYDVDEKVAAFDAGADDYVTKPFAMKELLARLRAVLRRPEGTEEVPHPEAHIGPWTIDLAGATVNRSGAAADRADTDPPRLTPTEWRILDVLLRRPGILVTSQEILRQVWGREHESKTNYLRVYFAGLRRKLEADPASPRHLLNEPGLGYRFEP
ncbi:two-component system, OmpR family, KDP operon response regulator KdpE [Actinacidiphila yanglinensis]|uniref:Two-component system, OmpR family, KDP operon response regulator KdpE n=1 Tax=Actinacidiphila yanglinensis TaxID=310779 RepID=A0A1H6D5W2_9ACTN|nr:response regulator transcription factor [Actinacidiphila yanglinensis]SEG80777.1 two-component system, OmpR family, KDP operon response regulator KdpE [Actinacidiphila yanglinensis]